MAASIEPIVRSAVAQLTSPQLDCIAALDSIEEVLEAAGGRDLAGHGVDGKMVSDLWWMLRTVGEVIGLL
jgi:hypothetical protein